MNSAFWKLLLVLTLCVIGFGFYRGWFTVSSETSDAPTNKINVNLTVDRDKVNKDARSVKNKTTEFAGEVTEEAKELVNQVKDRPRVDNSSRQ